MLVNRCKGNSIPIIRQNHNITVTVINRESFVNNIYMTFSGLLSNTGLFNQLTKYLCTAISYRGSGEDISIRILSIAIMDKAPIKCSTVKTSAPLALRVVALTVELYILCQGFYFRFTGRSVRIKVMPVFSATGF